MESSLAAQFKDLKADVGFFLGLGRGADFGETAWSAKDENSIARCVKGGLRKFYHSGYDWSFLKPVAALTLASGANTLDLPQDYGGHEGRVSVATRNNQDWHPLDFAGIGQVQDAEARFSNTTGWPQLLATEPMKDTSLYQGQRFRLHVWPTSDQAYTLKLQYYVLPDYLDGSKPYAYGGAEHAETLLEACLSVAETLLDDQATIHAAEFQRLLAISMDLDRRKKPQLLGYNADRSDSQHWGRWDRRDEPAVTFNGVQY